MRRSALITGGSGFVGRHTAAELESRGWDVVTVDVLPFDVPLAAFTSTSRLHIRDDMRSFVGTQRMADEVGTRFDLIVHCAYHIGGRRGIDGLNDHFTRNVALDSALFGWAIATRQPHVLYFSSSAIYPVSYQTEDPLPHIGVNRLSEQDQWIRGDGWIPDCDADYGWAKYVGECLAQNAIKNGVNVTVVRPFSGYGEDQSLDYPFPSFARRAALREHPFTIWGNARQVRDWIHIDDVVRGSLAVVDRDVQDPPINVPRPVNVCSGDGTALGDLAELMCRSVGYEADIVVDETAPMGVFSRVGDPTLFNEIYTPTVSLSEGITRAIQAVKK